MQPNRSLSKVVYSPESALRKPRTLFQTMGRDLIASRELAWRFFVRTLSVRYRQSILGPVWTFLPPLITALTFTFLKASGAMRIPETAMPYPFYVLYGTLMWQLFADGLQLPLNAMKRAQSLVKSIKMPIEALILAAVAETMFDKSVQFLILGILFIVFQIPVKLGIIFLPFVIFLFLALGTGLGLLLVPLGTLYTDVSSALPLITRFWFFLTPVVYPPPTRFPYSLMVDLNPVSPLLNSARTLITDGIIAQPLAFAIASGLSIVLLLGGWLIYRLSIPILVERS